MVTARDLLKSFDALSPAEQRHVMVEILRRSAATEDLTEANMDELAADLFRAYDADEAARADAGS